MTETPTGPDVTAPSDAAPDAAVPDAAVLDAAAEQALETADAVEPAEAPAQASEEPAAEEVATDEPAADDSVTDEPAAEEAVAEDSIAEEPAAHPAPAPIPVPRPSAPVAHAPTEQWGRVDDAGVVYVREGEDWRAVGEYPDATAEEALAYFERKYADLAGQVALVEQRSRSGAPAADIARTVSRLSASVEGANAVGDLASLTARLEALGGTVTELTQQQREEAKAAVEQAVAERTAIVESMEAIAARPLANAQWKAVSAEVDELFGRWQRHQAEGPTLPKSTADELWKRFRTARSHVDAQRKAFYSTLDAAHRDARTAKQALVARAEALADQGGDAIGTYRALLDEWKAAGRAGKRDDDRLWDRFKAAGDVLYAAKSERVAAENAEYTGNLEAKLALLDGAADIVSITDRSTAKDRLRRLQAGWDEIGRVPRERMRELEDRMRRIEDHVRALEDEHLRRSLPQKPAPVDSFSAKLVEAVEKAERDLEAATASGNEKAIAAAREALESRRAWLKAAKG